MTDIAKDKRPEAGLAWVDPGIVWAMEPFVDYARRTSPLRFLDGSIFIEPCAMGGAMIAAISGHAMAVVRDPEGQCSRPMAVDLPTVLFEACAPREPIRMSYCGEGYECPLPPWAQPGALWLTNAGSFLLPKMRHPDWAEENNEFHPVLFDAAASTTHHHVGRDYRCTIDKTFPWRRPLAIARGSEAQEAAFATAAPELIGLFARFHELFRRRLEDNPRVWMRFAAGGQMVVTFERQPDFVGTLMQMTPGEPEPMPAWFETYDAETTGSA
jgi:hypothetical protein